MNVIFDPKKATNSELLFRFEEGRDQAAFAEIVRRHGSMVRQTAWRITGSVEDSEDAFQAAFFALAKSVHRIRDKAALAGWLHRAAISSALQIQRANISWDQKGEQMKQGQVSEDCSPSQEVATEELRRIVDKAVAALPRKLQRAIVLCDLEGLSRAEAAKELGLPRSTVDSHVVKGRQILRQRIARLGFGLPAAGFAAFIKASSESSLLMGAELIEQTTTNAMLFSAGKNATEIGVASRIVDAANGVVAKMSTAFLLPITIAVALLLAVVAYATSFDTDATANAAPGLIFVDSFDDGNARDGRPVRWAAAPFLNGSFDASTGNLVLSATNDTEFAVGLPGEVLSHDSSIRTEARVSANGAAALVEVRSSAADEPNSYFAGIAYVREFGGSVFIVGRHDGHGRQHLFDSSNGGKIVILSHDVRESFTVVQLDAIGNEIRGWAWKSGEPMPSQPQFNITDTTLASGFPSLAVGTNLSKGGTAGVSQAIFRFVQFANLPIHEITESHDVAEDENMGLNN